VSDGERTFSPAQKAEHYMLGFEHPPDHREQNYELNSITRNIITCVPICAMPEPDRAVSGA